MEIQVGFTGLRASLSYECAGLVKIGDHVEITEGARKSMVGEVRALQRGSYRGTLAKCRKTTKSLTYGGDGEVKARLNDPDVIARQEEERRLALEQLAPGESAPAPTLRHHEYFNKHPEILHVTPDEEWWNACPNCGGEMVPLGSDNDTEQCVSCGYMPGL